MSEEQNKFEWLAHLNSDEFNFERKWKTSYDKDRKLSFLKDVFRNASKQGTDKKGMPDFFYYNENRGFLIIGEYKTKISDHYSEKNNKVSKYAVNGAKHYLSFFINNDKLKLTTKGKIKKLDILGLAISGRHDEKHMISTFLISQDEIQDIKTGDIHNDSYYGAISKSIDVDELIQKISLSSKKINNFLRSVNSAQRPIILSAIMIALHPDYRKTAGYLLDGEDELLPENIIKAMTIVLKKEGIDADRIKIIENQLSVLENPSLFLDSKKDVLRDIVDELEDSIIPIYEKGRHKHLRYDVIGKFYHEFLRFAGTGEVKKGIVLTPNHITHLFTDLVDIKYNDVIIDPCCGTGGFLIAGLEKLMKKANESGESQIERIEDNIKSKQLIGVESDPSMFVLSLANMLFHYDGKSKMFYGDFFEITEKLKDESPDIGFMNPPFSGDGSDSSSKKWAKEIAFLENLLDCCGKNVVVISPLRMFFKDKEIRNRILDRHTLQYVINMPQELFSPAAEQETAIAVFKTKEPHNGKEVVFYNLSDDGLEKSKHLGRRDKKSKWSTIKEDMLNKLEKPDQYKDSYDVFTKAITKNDEWILQAHSKTDLTEFKDTGNISEKINVEGQKYVINQTLISKKIDESNERIADCYAAIRDSEYNIKDLLDIDDKSDLRKSRFIGEYKEFKIGDIFEVKNGKRHKKDDHVSGEVRYISSTKFNNGIANEIEPPSFMMKYENVISINNSGSVGYAFYHNYPSVFSDSCCILTRPKDEELSKCYLWQYLYINSQIEKIREKFCFGYAWRIDRIKREILLLPAYSDRDTWYVDWAEIKDRVFKAISND